MCLLAGWCDILLNEVWECSFMCFQLWPDVSERVWLEAGLGLAWIWLSFTPAGGPGLWMEADVLSFTRFISLLMILAFAIHLCPSSPLGIRLWLEAFSLLVFLEVCFSLLFHRPFCSSHAQVNIDTKNVPIHTLIKQRVFNYDIPGKQFFL